jgi:hypothetical protein
MVARVCVRNMSRKREFTGSSALAVNVRTRLISEVIGLAGNPSTLTWGVPPSLPVCHGTQKVCDLGTVTAIIRPSPSRRR